MKLVLTLLLLIVGTGNPTAETSHDPRYVSEEYGFSFEYPKTWEIMKEEPEPGHGLLYRIRIGRFNPIMFVEVAANWDGLELQEFAYKWAWNHEREEIGFKDIIVADREALRATYFEDAGTGCATSVAFIPHRDHIIVVNTGCSSQTLPQILYSLRLSPSIEGR